MFVNTFELYYIYCITFLSQTDHNMMDYVDPIESLDATEIFLGQSLVVVRHWKETVSQVEEKTKVMVAQLKLMKVEAGKAKELDLELAKIIGGDEKVAR